MGDGDKGREVRSVRGRGLGSFAEGSSASAIPRGLGPGKEGRLLLSSSSPTRLPYSTGSPA